MVDTPAADYVAHLGLLAARETEIANLVAEIAGLRAQLAACMQPDGGTEPHRPDLRALFHAYEKASIEATTYESRLEEAAMREAAARAELLAALEGR